MGTRHCFRSILLPALILMLCALPAPGQPSDDCPGGAARVTVTVKPDQELLEVDPVRVEIFLKPGKGQPGRVCWKVVGLGEDDTLHIEGKARDDLFPDLERTVKAPRDFANSGRPAKTGSWEYSLWITRGDAEDRLHFTDPEVIVNGGGGESGTGGGGGGGGGR